ncbi:STAS domain-containing protein [Nonomuraea rosea]|uniref:Anti-sigma factor antagonist n=2 Tax=Nonomuraea rosea TaxID=638574 RepID=A0ABP6Z4H5_9ACTN
MSPLKLCCRPMSVGVLIAVTGELDATNTGQFESYLDSARLPGEPVLLDLGGLTFMDSSGLHVLLRLNAAAGEEGGAVHLAAIRDVPARMLEITGVWDALNIHPGVDEAAAAAQAGHADRHRETS